MMGIYRITNKITGQRYIGGSKNITSRWGEHVDALISNSHYNKKLLNSFNEYGILNFVFEVVEIVYNNDDLLKIEQKYINELNFENDYNLYNSCVEYVNKKIDEFMKWIDDNWAVDRYDRKDISKQIYKKDIINFIKIAQEYNILDVDNNKVTFRAIKKFLKERGYLIKECPATKKRQKYTVIININNNKSKINKHIDTDSILIPKRLRRKKSKTFT